MTEFRPQNTIAAFVTGTPQTWAIPLLQPNKINSILVTPSSTSVLLLFSTLANPPTVTQANGMLVNVDQTMQIGYGDEWQSVSVMTTNGGQAFLRMTFGANRPEQVF